MKTHIKLLNRTILVPPRSEPLFCHNSGSVLLKQRLRLDDIEPLFFNLQHLVAIISIPHPYQAGSFHDRCA